jgi:recombination protein RecA
MAKKDILDEVFGENHELESVLKQISKQYGEGTVMMLGESSKMNIEAIPSGSLSLDCALGIG